MTRAAARPGRWAGLADQYATPDTWNHGPA